MSASPQTTKDLPPQCNVTHIIGSIDNPAAGTTTWSLNLLAALRERGVNAQLLAATLLNEAAERPWVRQFPVDLRFPGLSAKLLQSSSLRLALQEAARSTQILHVNGLWRMPTLYAGWTASSTQRPLVVSPHGMLGAEALKFSALQKSVFETVAQRRALANASCWHATSEAEAQDIRRYGVTSPIAVIPIGVTELHSPAHHPQTHLHSPRSETRRVVLYLGRLHPVKGLNLLLQAWAKLESRYPQWDLWIVGPSENAYDEQLKSQANQLGLTQVHFFPAMHGPEKSEAYRRAELFVLPSLQENFGIVAAEALAAGCPVISTKGAPWAGLTTHRCGWWIEAGVHPLSDALAEAMSLPSAQLAEMGQRGREWVERDLSWSRITDDLLQLYRWCQQGGDPPNFMKFD